MLVLMILLPFLAGALAFAIRRDRPRRVLLILGALAQAGLVAASWGGHPAPVLGGALALDGAALLFLSLTTLLFLAAAFYGVGYLANEERDQEKRSRADKSGGIGIDFDYSHEHEQSSIPHSAFRIPHLENPQSAISDAPEAVLIGCLFFFLGTMTLVCLSQHLGVLWVAVEATTLASAPLIYFHRHRRSLEAAWKYLLICSIGIALALLGNFLLAVASAGPGGRESTLILSRLLARGDTLNPRWLEAAFIFLLVGYGTKMGLAPLHTWLPDAHSESPSVVSALLSGALLNCAFLGILRAQQVCVAAGLASFTSGLLIGFGLFSMGFAAALILGQADYKRMLAYSSVEHMGILALGVGLGGAGTFGALFHAINHSLTKAMLFFVAGNILALTKTKSTTEVRGLARLLPVSGVLWLAGFFSITGSPPFGTFMSEFTILKSALDQGHTAAGVIYMALLGLIFIAMATIVLRMVQGPAPRPDGASAAPLTPRREGWLNVAPPLALGLMVLMLGFYLPPPVARLLHDAARLFGGQ